MKNLRKKGFWLLFFACLSAVSLRAQTDSVNTVVQDSLLDLQQAQRNELLVRSDSIRLADSLQQVLLMQQITDLRAKDARKKRELEARLDSLKTAQEARDARTKQQVDSLKANTVGVPVQLFGDTLFYVYSRLGPFSPSDRARSIQAKLEMLVDKGIFDPEKLTVFPGEESNDITYEQVIIMSISRRDGFWLDQSKEAVAAEYVTRIKEGVAAYYERTGITHTLRRIALMLLVVAIFYFSIRYMNRGFTWLNRQIVQRNSEVIKGFRIRSYEFLSPDRQLNLIIWLLRTLKWIIIAMVIYLSLPAIFSIFPATKGIASLLLGYVLDPLKEIFLSVLGYLPNLATIVLIVLITYYFVSFLRFLATEIETGKLHLPGFYPDWAQSTFNLVRIIIYAFAFIVIFRYLPGSNSPVFQGVSVFLGLLISLGSSSAISNIIAGLVITYMRAFNIGDRVKIGDTVGDVLEKTMLVTRLRTIKNEEVTIPNSAILNGSTINYSSGAKASGLILNTTLTIGYDVPWRRVHELLIAAALKTQYIQPSPPPFVLQTSLDDFYVSYQLNAFTKMPGGAAKIYSELHGHIQDGFNEAGVEILSPHYRAARDGNMTTIPADYLPPDYEAPAFHIRQQKEKE